MIMFQYVSISFVKFRWNLSKAIFYVVQQIIANGIGYNSLDEMIFGKENEYL